VSRAARQRRQSAGFPPSPGPANGGVGANSSTEIGGWHRLSLYVPRTISTYASHAPIARATRQLRFQFADACQQGSDSGMSCRQRWAPRCPAARPSKNTPPPCIFTGQTAWRQESRRRPVGRVDLRSACGASGVRLMRCDAARGRMLFTASELCRLHFSRISRAHERATPPGDTTPSSPCDTN
jgi:hypothetical protein